MKEEIKKAESAPVIINDRELKVGDVIISRRRDEYYVVAEIKSKNEGDYIYLNYPNGEGYSSISKSDIEHYYTVVQNEIKIDEAEEIADQIMKGKLNIDSLREHKKQEEGLMVVNADLYLKRREELRKIEQKISLINIIVAQKVNAIKRNINEVISSYQKVISKLNKIIFTLELYAGIEENIKQIQEGIPSNDEEPIHLMQLMKYMDEEVGDPENEGISFDSIEKFDNWLLSFNKYLGYHNYELLIPHNKGVRAVRVRRHAKEEWTRDPWNNYWKIRQEMKTYVIIRNGTNFYTIDSKMEFSEKLFPDIQELTDFYNKGGDFMEDEKMNNYKHGMILMQGLIDRTTVFGNLSGVVSFFKNESVESGRIIFNYENEDNLITDGSLSSLDFLNTSAIAAGDRILINNPDIGYRAGRIYKQYFQNEYRHPENPDTGIYKLEYDKEYKCLYFTYKPNDIIWSPERGSHERKKGFSFKVNKGDDNIVNIDMVSHRNIEWITKMMYDRRDRKNYLRANGLLRCLKIYKQKELDEEKPFVQLIMQQCGVDELAAMDEVHWWKTKNKHKRPITVDDQKALRMISKKLKNTLKA